MAPLAQKSSGLHAEAPNAKSKPSIDALILSASMIGVGIYVGGAINKGGKVLDGGVKAFKVHVVTAEPAPTRLNKFQFWSGHLPPPELSRHYDVLAAEADATPGKGLGGAKPA